MSREEAIKELTDLLPEEFLSEYTEAIKMGIEALEQEPCEDAISRKAAIDAIWDGVNMDIYTREVKECLETLPPVTPQPKMGRWIEHINNGMQYIECPKCSSWFLRMYLTRNSYCPNCGAKMQEVEG